MKTITKIEVQKKNTDRVSIYIDGIFAFGIPMDDVIKHGLTKNKSYTEEEYEKLVEEVLLQKAKHKALDYLSYKMRTSHQVREKLISLEYDEWIIEEVIRFLCKYKYIDDEAYANRYIDGQIRYNKKSLRKVKNDLYLKGIKTFNIENEEELWLLQEQNVNAFLEKYHYHPGLELKEKQKITNRLLNRGFDFELIRQCINNLDTSFKI